MVSENRRDRRDRRDRRSLNPCCCGRWSQSLISRTLSKNLPTVLILVVVEDGLREGTVVGCVKIKRSVLILVVVEDGLRGLILLPEGRVIFVLILVVVEDGLRGAYAVFYYN